MKGRDQVVSGLAMYLDLRTVALFARAGPASAACPFIPQKLPDPSLMHGMFHSYMLVSLSSPPTATVLDLRCKRSRVV